MASPKIGRITFGPEKSEVLKIADDLAAKSRILRRAATAAPEPEEVADRLRRLGEQFASERWQRETETARKDVSEIEPLIEKARELIADAEQARIEARPVLESLDAVPWSALDKRLSFEHGLVLGSQQSEESLGLVPDEEIGGATVANFGSRFSTDNTKLRIARLRAALNDLRPFVDPRSDSELRARLADAEAAVSAVPDNFGNVPVTEHDRSRSDWKQTWESQFRYAVNGLRLGLSYGSVGDAIRNKVAGIKKLLAEIGEDVLSIGNEGAK